MSKNLCWQRTKKSVLLETRVVSVNEYESTSPSGELGKYIVMDAPDWLITIPVLENPNRFIMVKQWRHGLNALSTEFPGGVIDKNEKPEEAAVRELKEETGYIAQKLELLGSFSPNPAIMSNKVHCFAAYDLVATGKQNLDNDEYVNYFELSEEEVFAKMGSEDFPHGLMIAALELYRQNKKKQ